MQIIPHIILHSKNASLGKESESTCQTFPPNEDWLFLPAYTMLSSSLEDKHSHTMQNEVGTKPGGTAVAVQLNSKLLTAPMTMHNDVGDNVQLN